MKLYTDETQTAKLIELGFEKTNVKVDTVISTLNGIQQATLTIINEFSIGELIEMLPPKIGEWDLWIERYWNFEQWHVSYNPSTHIFCSTELCDALYNCIVKLKEEGVI